MTHTVCEWGKRSRSSITPAFLSDLFLVTHTHTHAPFYTFVPLSSICLSVCVQDQVWPFHLHVCVCASVHRSISNSLVYSQSSLSNRTVVAENVSDYKVFQHQQPRHHHHHHYHLLFIPLMITNFESNVCVFQSPLVTTGPVCQLHKNRIQLRLF